MIHRLRRLAQIPAVTEPDCLRLHFARQPVDTFLLRACVTSVVIPSQIRGLRRLMDRHEVPAEERVYSSSSSWAT